jgi:hypothetical protein
MKYGRFVLKYPEKSLRLKEKRKKHSRLNQPRLELKEKKQLIATNVKEIEKHPIFARRW